MTAEHEDDGTREALTAAAEEFIQGMAEPVVEEVSKMEKTARESDREIEAWRETAALHCRNEGYYRGLLEIIGVKFGKDAYVSDDGSVQEDVLIAKVPELVDELREQRNKLLLACRRVLAMYDKALATNQPVTWSGEHVDAMRAAVALCFKGSGTPVPLTCANCGEVSTNPGQFLTDGRWCCTESCRKELVQCG